MSKTSKPRRRRRKKTTYTVAHVNSAGTGVAATEIDAFTEGHMKKIFTRLYPERELSTYGVKGEG